MADLRSIFSLSFRLLLILQFQKHTSCLFAFPSFYMDSNSALMCGEKSEVNLTRVNVSSAYACTLFSQRQRLAALSVVSTVYLRAVTCARASAHASQGLTGFPFAGRGDKEHVSPMTSLAPSEQTRCAHLPVRSMVIGPGAVSQTRVRRVTTTLGAVGSADSKRNVSPGKRGVCSVCACTFQGERERV